LTPKQFAPYLARDGRCLHCGTTEGLVPQHRAGRGMGGSKERHRPSNIIVLCGIYNGLIEADANKAAEARSYGWKLSGWDDPLTRPVFDRSSGLWWLLDDDFRRVAYELPAVGS
jgi:hypothetical protein